MSMERKALGRGIGALIPESSAERKEQIYFVAPGKIKPNTLQPREQFDDASIAELAQSIKEKGIIQPLVVRRQGDQYELIAGERRLRACLQLGLAEVPVIVKNVEDRDSLEIALIENIQRENLNAIEEARAYQYLIEKFRITNDEIGEILGKDSSTISNTLRLLRLPQEIQDEIKKSRISYGHGRALLEIEDLNHQRRLMQEVITKGLSVRELENMIKVSRPRFSPKNRVRHESADPLVAALEEKLRHTLATKVKINRLKKRGNISIDFYSREDLERIVNAITGNKTI